LNGGFTQNFAACAESAFPNKIHEVRRSFVAAILNGTAEDKATSTRFAIANACPRGAETFVFASSRRSANSESSTADRIAQAGLAQIHSERPKINGFAVVEAHQNRKKVV